MLYSIPDLKRIQDVPHRSDYDHWLARLNHIDPQAFQRICDDLDRRFDARDVDTSSWIPGAVWTETIFEPIYRACGHDEVSAGLFFGLIVWQVVMDRGDCWSFGRYEKGGIPIRGMTYFRIACPE
jgi:hypothetical protein